MEPRPITPTSPDPGPFDVAFVLLLLQTAFGLLAVVGTIVLGIALGALPLIGGSILLGLAGPTVTLVLAVGIARFRRWARTATVVFEALLILGLLVRLAIGRQYALGLVPLLTGVLLPIAILTLLLSRPARRGLAASRQPSPLTRLEHPSTLKPAA
jgi:hypothetical protein